MIGEYERLEIQKAFWKGAKIESTFKGRNKWEEATPSIFVWSLFDYRIKNKYSNGKARNKKAD